MSIIFGTSTLTTPLHVAGAAVKVTRAPFAAEVANLGGIGTIGASGMPPNEVGEEIDRAQDLRDPSRPGALAINQMLLGGWGGKTIEIAIEKGIDVIFASAGLPSRDLFIKARKAGVSMVPVSSRGSFFRAMDMAGIEPELIDYVKLESDPAGGHLGTHGPKETTVKLLTDSRKAAEKAGYGHVHFIAAGGIGDIEDVCAAHDADADIVSMGTRAFLTPELGPELANWQSVLLSAEPENIVVLGKASRCEGKGSPANYRARAVQNWLIEELLREGVVKFPGEPRSCVGCLAKCIYRDSGRTQSCCIIQHLELAVTEPENEEHAEFIKKYGWFFCGAKTGEYNELICLADCFKMVNEVYGS